MSLCLSDCHLSQFVPSERLSFDLLVCSFHNLSCYFQCVFTSLAYLFKFLWRYMVKDIERVFKLHSELLHLTTKTHIRQFAVESFGFLLRKVCYKLSHWKCIILNHMFIMSVMQVRNHDVLFDMIFNHLSENPDVSYCA